MARVPLICFDIVEWHLPDRVLRQYGRVQSVPDRCDTEWRLHATDRRGRAGTDWSVHHMRYIQLWDARRDSIVQADWSDGVLPSPDPYMLWYRRHTHLLVGNPSHISAAGYQRVGPSLEALVVRVGRSYHLAEDAIFRRDGPLGLQALAEIRELLYEGIQHAHRVDRLHFGDYGLHSAAAAPDTSGPSTSVPPTSAPPIAGPSTSVTPPHYTPYISPDSPYVHPTQHVDPDWTPPRFMHDVVTPPTQLPPAFLGTTSTAPMSAHDAVLTDISHVDDEAHIEPPPEREGEAEVMVVGDVAAEVRVQAEVEVQVQLQIVIQLHQMREFHSSQQYPTFRQRLDQGQPVQERGGHTHKIHRESVEGHMQGRECQMFREFTAGDRGGRSTVGVVGLGAG
ncbi:hypothetical protein ACSBR2_033507 [Camellia fascicularis]